PAGPPGTSRPSRGPTSTRRPPEYTSTGPSSRNSKVPPLHRQTRQRLSTDSQPTMSAASHHLVGSRSSGPGTDAISTRRGSDMNKRLQLAVLGFTAAASTVLGLAAAPRAPAATGEPGAHPYS